MKNWAKVKIVNQNHQALIAKEFLSEHEIESVILNKKDSSYNNFGNYEIFVPEIEKERALSLINEFLSF